MKKIISLLICIVFISVISEPAFCEYDFSDEAQAEFDKNKQESIINPSSPKDYSKTRRKRQIKTTDSDRTNYTPSGELLYDETKNQPQTMQNQNKIVIPQYPSNNQLYGSVVQIPSGTAFDVAFDSGISSGSLEKNDRLTVRLTQDLEYGGRIVAPAGSLVYGTAEDAQNAGYAYGSGSLALNFNQILTPDGNMLNISTRTIILKSKSERAAKVTRDVVIGAVGSLAVGALLTALSGGNNWGRNMAIYGGIGALGGGIHAATQRGTDVQIPDGTIIKVTLTDNLRAEEYKF